MCVLLCSLAQHFNAGLLSGVLTTVIMTPGERIKCNMQVKTLQRVSTVVSWTPRFHVSRL